MSVSDDKYEEATFPLYAVQIDLDLNVYRKVGEAAQLLLDDPEQRRQLEIEAYECGVSVEELARQIAWFAVG